MNTSYIKTSELITILFDDGQMGTMYASSPRYGELCDAIKELDWKTAKLIMFPAKQIEKSIKDTHLSDRVKIDGGVVKIDNFPMHNTLTSRMIEMLNQGYNISHMILFVENLVNNPSKRAVDELYDFLEASNLPITNDGCFLAYKRIRDDFKDVYTGKIDNSPGKVVSMPRYQVNENKDETCSSGLHFCAYDYLPHYGNNSGTKVVIVKINPKDVVSIPSDYNNTKGRCCEYTVIRELPYETNKYMPATKLETQYVDLNFCEDDRVEVTKNNNVPPIKSKDQSVRRLDLKGNILNEYYSHHYAEKYTGIRASDIARVCNGKRKTTGGYRWEWIVPR